MIIALEQIPQDFIPLFERVSQGEELQIEHQGQLFTLKKTASPFDVGDINRPDISVDEIVDAIHQSRRNV